MKSSLLLYSKNKTDYPEEDELSGGFSCRTTGRHAARSGIQHKCGVRVACT